MLRKNFTYRLYPTQAQETALETQLELCCRLYNAMLEQRRMAWKSHRKTISEYDQSKEIVDVVKELPEYRAVYSQTLRDVAARLERAFQAFFRRLRSGEKPGYPRFRSVRRYDSLTYRQPGNGSVRFRGHRVSLSKLATNVRLVLHRPLQGRMRVVTIRRQADRWFLHVTCDQVSPTLTCGTGAVGVDMGLTTLAVLSDGSRVENPRFAAQAQAKLARAQRNLARCRKGSNRRRKRVLLLQKLHMKVANQRRYAFHLAARRILQQNGFIAVERLEP